MGSIIYKVSVIIPIYKVESYIEHCARTLFEQTFENIEYIFVDDCSPDRSIEILRRVMEEYPKRIPDIKIVNHATNKGSATARNTGLREVTGEYIGWVDCDDWIDLDSFEQMYETAISSQADIVWCDFYNSISGVELLCKQENSINSIECLRSLLTEKMCGALWNKLVKSTLYSEHNIRFVDGLNMWEDLYVTTQLFFYAKRLTYFPKSFYHYVYYNKDLLYRTFQEKELDDVVQNADGIINFLNEKKVKEVESEICFLKLAAKQTLLFQTDKQYFLRWRTIFPEANSYVITYKMLPIHLRIIGWCTWKQLWIVVSSWIYLKKKILNAKLGCDK